jgi:hypothetical protein
MYYSRIRSIVQCALPQSILKFSTWSNMWVSSEALPVERCLFKLESLISGVGHGKEIRVFIIHISDIHQFSCRCHLTSWLSTIFPLSQDNEISMIASGSPVTYSLKPCSASKVVEPREAPKILDVRPVVPSLDCWQEVIRYLGCQSWQPDHCG